MTKKYSALYKMQGHDLFQKVGPTRTKLSCYLTTLCGNKNHWRLPHPSSRFWTGTVGVQTAAELGRSSFCLTLCIIRCMVRGNNYATLCCGEKNSTPRTGGERYKQYFYRISWSTGQWTPRMTAARSLKSVCVLDNYYLFFLLWCCGVPVLILNKRILISYT